MKSMLFAGLALSLAAVSAPVRAADEPTIAGFVAGSKDHTILLAAIKEAGLVEMLNDPKAELTLFAPTDAAFKNLGDAKVQEVIKNKELLKSILLAHAVKGRVMAADVLKLDGQPVKTVGGAEFPVSAKGPKVGDATVTVPDLKASNGVVHVIDAVLIPTK